MVRRIVESQQFACPAGAAASFVEREVEMHQSGRGRLSMHVRVPLVGSLALDKEVEAVLTLLQNGGETHTIAIAWQPAGGPFPRFRGTLRIEPVGDDACLLTVAGAYEPPAGMLGALFDAAIGRRIARTTMRDLIARIRASVMAEYERRMRMAGV